MRAQCLEFCFFFCKRESSKFYVQIFGLISLFFSNSQLLNGKIRKCVLLGMGFVKGPFLVLLCINLTHYLNFNTTIYTDTILL